MIASVAFRNFKALRSTSLVLAPFNLLVGANGSGKSSLIQALLRLRTLSRLSAGDGAPAAIRANGPAIEFHFSPPHETVTVQLQCVTDFVCDRLQLSPPDAPGWPALRGELARIRSYLLDHYAMAEPAARASGGELATNGGNLAAVLAGLRARSPDAFVAIAEEVVRILPEFTAVELDERDSTVGLGLRLIDGDLVTAENLSQGALYTLAVLALAYDPTPPSVLCIEELDRGIHPRLLREIRDALYRLSHPESVGLTRAPVQIVATTHSPYLLDLFRDHPEEIVIAQKHGREARFERLVDHAGLAELLREGPLGDMWFSGILGGVPEEE